MSTRTLPFDVSPRQQGYFALLLWVVGVALLVRRDLFGVDEGAARSLLLSWSIADQLASPVVTYGMPDLRLLLFLPIGYLWTGSIVAAKVLSAVVLGGAAWLLHGWLKRLYGGEAALLATGLMLISPLALAQVDAIGVGAYLLGVFAIGAWLDLHYRANPRPFNGWYFAQLIACAFAVSLHPAGLAYPLALLASWRTLPLSPKHRGYFLGGTVFAGAFMLYVRKGWGDATWLQDPLGSLGSILTGPLLEVSQGAAAWLPGVAVLAVAAAVVLLKRKDLWTDLLGRTLLIGSLTGVALGDQAWALVVLALILYFGLPLLLRPAQGGAEGGGFMKQRGWALLLLFACSTVFMGADKTYYGTSRGGVLSAQDELIKTIAVAAEGDRKAAEGDEGERKRPRFVVASEWPGRTMLACRCETHKLPPAQHDPESQLNKLHGVTYLTLDPKRTANTELARNLAMLGGVVETVSLQPGGVVLHVRETTPPKPEGEGKKPE